MSADFLEKDIVYVSSASPKVVSGTTNDFIIDLTDQIKFPNNYDTACLLKASIPKSYYLFNSTNNVFTVTESKTTTTITIPVGNYGISSLVTTLKSLLTACTWSYSTSTYSTSTGKITFSVTGNGGVQPIFDFSGSTSPYLILGFEQSPYTFSGSSLTSPNVVNLQLTNTILLMADIVDRSGLFNVIVPNNSDFTTINYIEQNPTFTSRNLIKLNVQNVHFKLLDGNTGNALDLNGLDINFVFAIYKSNNYFKTQLIETHLRLLESSLLDSLED
jgi:hypothetical protein